MTKPNTAPKIGPWSSPNRLTRIDGRTRESKLVRETRAELLAHVGPNPSAVQLMLIEQLIQLKLRISVMDRKWIKTGKATDLDNRTYLAWVNTFGRLLERLGVREPSPALLEPPTGLADHIAATAPQAAQQPPVTASEAAD
jgi:hypothetical protein